ncbi:hypothetical protein [Thiocapsa rosea]|uniref:hypothetical protein n=1 Tax=Thiocapsa rosea TaxID=69360 RepID=UPI000EAED79E|nr:hypothetical protein [Thiocapsa rosea]
MTTSELRNKLRDEIRKLPDSHLQEVFDIIHFFRLGLEREPPKTVSDVMRFAGAWEDMEDPDGFEVELGERRSSTPRHARPARPSTTWIP